MPQSEWIKGGGRSGGQARGQGAEAADPVRHKLPSGTELCAEFTVSRQVVRSAIDWLKARGLVDGAPGAGVFVRERATQ
ncbi:hypothetical protein CA850_06930 [Micromonospora echinospora]|uniref:Regulatory protein, gntR family n=1 Tax=Micromonospora echinospora TaxID=1877 RepID=A0A1C4VBF6_MICEC|nr:GntR family transcriptional regulator [Micromonospora echinospora]OZV83212.1 hypothetical protein CA850_06930 [Micromonospora echinospora]SCE81099.1 regulatory protein, gntR family [Micromonospora echinospora]